MMALKFLRYRSQNGSEELQTNCIVAGKRDWVLMLDATRLLLIPGASYIARSLLVNNKD
jgi:hypothetical protein